MQAVRRIADHRAYFCFAVLPLIVLTYLSIAAAPIHAFNKMWEGAHLDAVVPLFWVWPIAHMTAYTTLTLLLSRISWLRRQGIWFALAVGAIGFGYEIAQTFTVERHFEGIDLIANSCGIAFASVILEFERWWIERRG